MEQIRNDAELIVRGFYPEMVGDPTWDIIVDACVTVMKSKAIEGSHVEITKRELTRGITEILRSMEETN